MAWLAGVSDFDLLGVMVSDALDEEVLVVVTMFCMKSSLNLTLTLKPHTSPLLRISADTIFVTAQHEPTNGIIGVNRKGQVP